MPAKKKPVTTPLHLLQQLSHSLLEHLESACSEALVEAEKLLARLEKQRSKVQDKLHKANQKLQDAAVAGKQKAQARGREAVAELEELLDALKARQSETREYIARLKVDIEKSLHLAQGVGKVGTAAAEALQGRAEGKDTAQRAPAPKAAGGTSRARTRKASAASPAASDEAPAPAPAGTARPASTRRRKPAATPSDDTPQA